jgi:hypothetical protein
MMEFLGVKDAFGLLNQTEHEMIYLSHVRPIKFINDNSAREQLSKSELKLLNDTFTLILKNCDVCVGPEQKSVSLYDFFTIVESILAYWKNCTDDEFANAKAFKAKFAIFDDNFYNTRLNVFQQIITMLNGMMLLVSDLTTHYLWTKVSMGKAINRNPNITGVFNDQIVHVVMPNTRVIEIDGKRRTIFRLGFVEENGINWFAVKPEFLNIKIATKKTELSLYIQMHTKERFVERLGVQFENFLYMMMLESLLSNNISYSEDGSYLFPVRYCEIKMGYFKVDLIDDILLAKTFLFLTNNGTPEGKKLSKLIGVKKEDKAYLGIDRLDKFINSDIEQNQKLKDIFTKAGCGDLFKLKDLVDCDSDKVEHCANFILRYLQLEKEMSEYEIGVR